ncbi:Acyl-CoA--sterol O-acyltransferase [Trema orientale]|uniref:Acyl-CoA--sterol O-acyltransferase n=1 Tax=Trema orientale TaxID=63057 RepID=A0A2P5EGX3_TREOI|nr:Acyl-CoA--sterol O-acyltransferase [Trema orientale]
MEGEMNKFFKVCLAIVVSLTYCYVIGKIVSKGAKRLICVLPIVCLFLYLPLNLSSINCGGITGFFISWLANFKLLLFAFGKGPLALDPPNNSLGRFIAYACFPIEIPKNPPQIDQKVHNPSPPKSTKHNPNGKNRENPSRKPLDKPKNASNHMIQSPTKSNSRGQNRENPSHKTPKQGQKWVLVYALKALVLAILVTRVFDYKEYMHSKVILFLYSLYIYLILDIILATTAGLARALKGVELEPHFDEPYLSSSLQDFWGRRWASIPAVTATFMVSGLMHELIFYYWCRVWPTWEATWFFILHGSCLSAEIVLKRVVGTTDTWRVSRLISGPLTVGFVMESCFRLLFPHVIQCKTDLRLLQEYDAIGAFLKSITHKLSLSS